MKIKICGITLEDDAHVVEAEGADYIGFIFYPKSARYLSIDQAAELRQSLKTNIKTVGVFVNEAPETIQTIAEKVALDCIQFHGEESVSSMNAFSAYDCLKALSIKSESDLEKADEYGNFQLLVDTPSPEYGGSGQTCDWSLASKLAKKHPIFLAGGINLSNCIEAIETVAPYGLDLSSGVEISKGIKDHQKIIDFMAAVNPYR